jgi:DNA-binding response OmpR family regulator
MTKILVAEDELELRELITYILHIASYDVVEAASGEEVVTLTRQEFPDLVLLDVRLPGMTGYEACRIIKADARLQHIPVVFLSAKGRASEIQAGFDAGADEYIVKPVTPRQLLGYVRGQLIQRRGKAGALPYSFPGEDALQPGQP